MLAVLEGERGVGGLWLLQREIAFQPVPWAFPARLLFVLWPCAGQGGMKGPARP